jgi:hypothetical protein
MDTNDINRFWRHVDKTGDCWLWKLGCSPKGYGQFTYKTERGWRIKLAHRVAMGDVPAGKNLHNKCGNRSCCKPEHWQVGDDLTAYLEAQNKT